MIKRYLIHMLNHTILLIDVTPVGLPAQVFPPEGLEQTLVSFRFQTWQTAEQFLRKAGADAELLHATRRTLNATSLAVLTIPH